MDSEENWTIIFTELFCIGNYIHNLKLRDISEMEEKYKIIVAEDFSDTPGARDRDDGDFSGETFLNKHLLPEFEKAVQDKCFLTIDLNGAYGYPSSFISASFGKLSVMKGKDILLRHLKFISNNPLSVDKIISEIKNPEKL